MSDQQGQEEYYRLTQAKLSEARVLRGRGKWTMAELADKLGVSLEDLLHDFALRDREIEGMDD
jgi:predicted DNA-binding transcriptional regulator YafY